MKTTIYLIRHAEVENPNHIIYGRLPRFPLSANGMKQAKKLAEHFKEKNIDAIYCSPLLRARQTAKAISDGKIPIYYSSLLSEIDYKEWEGKPASHRDKKEVELYIKKPTEANFGETLNECLERMLKKIEEIVNENPGKNIIIVSHADPIICSRLHFEGKSLDTINKTITKKASITSLEFNKGLKCNKVRYYEIVEAEKDYP